MHNAFAVTLQLQGEPEATTVTKSNGTTGPGWKVRMQSTKSPGLWASALESRVPPPWQIIMVADGKVLPWDPSKNAYFFGRAVALSVGSKKRKAEPSVKAQAQPKAQAKPKAPTKTKKQRQGQSGAEVASAGAADAEPDVTPETLTDASVATSAQQEVEPEFEPEVEPEIETETETVTVTETK